MAAARIDEVTCSFCLEFGRYLTRPRELACGHIYCEPCLQSNLETNKIVGCPKCNTVYDVDINDLPLAGLSGSTTPVWCDVCLKKGDRNRSQSYCTECRKCLCTKHQQSHDDLHDDHKKMTISEYRQQTRKLESRKCTKHPGQAYITGCKTCLDIFCAKCTTERTQCDEGEPHRTLVLDELVKYIEGKINRLRKNAYSVDAALSALIKNTTNILDEQKTETDRIIQLLHKTRDEQIEFIRAKYNRLETELREKREKTHTDIQEFMDYKLGETLFGLRRELKLTEARLRDNHQVDIVKSFRETERLIHSLIVKNIPSLKVDNVVSLTKQGAHRGIEVGITPGECIRITSDQLPLLHRSLAPWSMLPPVKLPTSLTFIREICVSDMCITVSGRNDQLYVGLWNGKVNTIGPAGQPQKFLTGQGLIRGMDMHDDKIIISTRNHVCVCDVKSGEHKHTWAHSDVSISISSNLAVVDDEVVVTDRGNKRLSVYTLTGQLVRHIPCQQIGDNNVALCFADNYSVILSDYGTGKVHRINISSGQILWTSSNVVSPQGVICFNNQYVFVTSKEENVKIWILDIKTGKYLGDLVDRIERPDSSVYSLYIDGDNLIVPRYREKKVYTYKIQ